MTNLLDMNQRMNQWMAEKPGFDGIELRLFDGDVMLGHFVATGQDGDAFIKVYKSHVFPGINQRTGKRFNNYRYCTLQNDNTECVFCAQGHADIKERMSMWFYVYSLLHASPVQQKPNLPQGSYNGRVYYQEEINGFKRWDDSAWSQSPWGSILQLYQMYGQNLHAFVVSLSCSGVQMTKRFTVFPLPNSASLPPEIYQRAIQECTPIPTTLRAQQQQPVQVAPAAAVQALPQGQPVPAFSIPGTPAPAPVAVTWGPPAAAPAAAAMITPVAAVPAAAPQPVVAPVPDIGIPTGAPVQPLPMPVPPAAVAPVAVAAPVPVTPITPPASPVAPPVAAVPGYVPAEPVAAPAAPPVAAQPAAAPPPPPQAPVIQDPVPAAAPRRVF